MSEIQKIEVGAMLARKIEKFNGKILNKKPLPSRIKKNPYANNALYISISDVEMDMDKVFFGQWSCRMVGQPQILGNSVVVSVEVEFLHPVSGNWLVRVGTGAQDVQTDANGRAKAKALIKAVPAAKSTAFKNACKSIGKLFGRDLNRTDEAQFAETAEAISNIVNPANDGE